MSTYWGRISRLGSPRSTNHGGWNYRRPARDRTEARSTINSVSNVIFCANTHRSCWLLFFFVTNYVRFLLRNRSRARAPRKFGQFRTRELHKSAPFRQKRWLADLQLTAVLPRNCVKIAQRREMPQLGSTPVRAALPRSILCARERGMSNYLRRNRHRRHRPCSSLSASSHARRFGG